MNLEVVGSILTQHPIFFNMSILAIDEFELDLAVIEQRLDDTDKAVDFAFGSIVDSMGGAEKALTSELARSINRKIMEEMLDITGVTNLNKLPIPSWQEKLFTL